MKKCLTERSHGCWERGKQGPSSSSFHSLPRASSGPASQDKSFYQPKNPQGHHWAAAAVFGSPLHSPTAPKGIPAPELTHGSGSILTCWGSGASPGWALLPQTAHPHARGSSQRTQPVATKPWPGKRPARKQGRETKQ